MRTFSPALTAQLARTDGAEFRPLLVIHAQPGLFSARYLSTSSWVLDGVTVEAELLSITGLDETVERLGDVGVEVLDTDNNRIHIGLMKRMSIYLWSPSAGLSSLPAEDIVFKGIVSNPISRSGGKIRFDLISYGYTHNRLVSHPISREDFPYIEGEMIGKNLPVIYGTVPDVSGISVIANFTTSLQLGITYSATSIFVVNASNFPESGYIRIENETIYYAGQSDNQLLECSRGVGTVAMAHAKGCRVMLISGSYIYRLAHHPVHDVWGVMYGDVELYWDDGHYALQPEGLDLAISAAAAMGRFEDDLECIATVQGWSDDASGSITGTPGHLIEQPRHVFRHLLRVYGGASQNETKSEDFDSTPLAYFGIYLPEQFRVIDLIRGLADMLGGAIIYSGGRWSFRRYPEAPYQPVFAITETDIVQGEDGGSSLSTESADIEDLVSDVSCRYGLFPNGSWNGSFDMSTDSITDKKISKDFPYNYNRQQAEGLVSKYLERNSGYTNGKVDNVKYITFSSLISLIGIEVGDTVSVIHPMLGVGYKIHGWVTRVRKDLTGTNFGTVQISLEVLEWTAV